MQVSKKKNYPFSSINIFFTSNLDEIYCKSTPGVTHVSNKKKKKLGKNCRMNEESE